MDSSNQGEAGMGRQNTAGNETSKKHVSYHTHLPHPHHTCGASMIAYQGESDPSLCGSFNDPEK